MRNRVIEKFIEWLRSHPDIMVNIGDPGFCVELYQSLINSQVIVDPRILFQDSPVELEEVMFNFIESGKSLFDVSRSFRGAGGVVADLRNFHLGTSESYVDWYMCADTPSLSPRIQQIYDELNITWSLLLH